MKAFSSLLPCPRNRTREFPFPSHHLHTSRVACTMVEMMHHHSRLYPLILNCRTSASPTSTEKETLDCTSSSRASFDAKAQPPPGQAHTRVGTSKRCRAGTHICPSPRRPPLLASNLFRCEGGRRGRLSKSQRMISPNPRGGV